MYVLGVGSIVMLIEVEDPASPRLGCSVHNSVRYEKASW